MGWVQLRRAWLGSLSRFSGSEIALAQHLDMVRQVAGDDEAEREHRERIAAGDAASRPGGWLQVAKEIDACPANVVELLHVGSPGQAIGLRACGGNVLIEAGQRRVKAAAEPEGAHDEGTLRVVDVAECLADAPLVG